MKGFRTLGLNLFAAMLPILQATNAIDLGLDGTGALIFGSVLAILNVILRFFTTTKVGTSA